MQRHDGIRARRTRPGEGRAEEVELWGISVNINRLMGRFLFAALFFVALVGAVLLVFYGEEEPPRGAEQYFKKLGIEKPEKGVPAPDFTLKDLSGKSVSMQALRGRVVFLNFWATWCVPCRDEMPTMEKLHREFKDQGLEIVAVNFRESKKEVKEFFAELGLTFTTLLDADFTVFQKYSVWSLPMTHLIDRKGQLVGKAIGYREWDSKEARAFLRDLLQEKIR